MRMERLTSKLQSALADAQSLAIGKDNSQIEPAHLMLALIDQKGGSVRPLLMQVGFDVNTLRADLVGMVEQLPQVSSPTGDIQTSQPLYRMLNLADKKAQQAGDQFISSETMLLVMMAVMEINGMHDWMLHIYGSVLVAARASHAYGIYTSAGTSIFRFGGMIATFSLLLIGGIACIVRYFVI